MNRFQFSIRGMLFASVVVALALAAMVSRAESQYLAVIFCTLVFGVFFYAILSGIFRRGAAQVFWGGFAVGGVVYLFTLGEFSRCNPLDSIPLLPTRMLEITSEVAYAHSELVLGVGVNPNNGIAYRPSVTSVYVPPLPTPPPPSDAALGSEPKKEGISAEPDYTILQPIDVDISHYASSVYSTNAAVPRSFFLGGQLLWTLILAYIGGTVARMFYLGRARQPMT